MPNIGPTELIIVLVIALVIFHRRLPAAGRAVGGGVRNFKDSIRGRFDRGLEEKTAER
jgi:sec-independent protein translocase protein TatA